MSDLESQLADLRKKLKEKQQKASEYAAKNKSMLELSKLLSDGYVSSINIIIDISGLLTSYKEVVTDLVATLESLNITDNGLIELQTETKAKLADLDVKFTEGLKKLTDVIQNSKDKESYSKNLKNLEAVKEAAKLQGGSFSIKESLQKALQKS